jgi:prefoldin alpha subunit
MSSEEEKINNLIMESRLLESTYNELTNRQGLVERMLIESRGSLDTIREVGSASTEEVLIPVGAGVLLRASPPKVDKVLVGIGANVVMEKSKEDAEKTMEARLKELEEGLITILTQRNQVAQRLDADRRALQTFIDRQQRAQQGPSK